MVARYSVIVVQDSTYFNNNAVALFSGGKLYLRVGVLGNLKPYRELSFHSVIHHLRPTINNAGPHYIGFEALMSSL